MQAEEPKSIIKHGGPGKTFVLLESQKTMGMRNENTNSEGQPNARIAENIGDAQR